MIYLFDKDEKLIKIVRKSAVKTALQKYALTTERYVSDRLTVELKGLNADELEQIEYMAIQTMEDDHTFHYFYVAQKSSDELTTLIGVQSGIEELRKSPVYDKRPQNASARDVITDLLASTNWLVRFVGETTPHSTNFYYTSVFDALKKVCEVWDLEMQFFVEMNGNHIGGRYIDFKRRIGEAVGKRVVYGHNALQILQEVERTNIFTALIGRGKGEETGDGYGRKITFEDVVWSTTQGKPVNKPKGQKYLELPSMTRQYGIKNVDGSMRPKIGFVDFSEEENPEVLIERTYGALVDAARPQLTLKTSSVYLKGVKIGDTIRVVRHDKKLDYDTRIFEITFNRLNNQSSDIKLGDRIGESNEAKVQTIADKAVEQFVTNEFSSFVQNLSNFLPNADGFSTNWYGDEDPTTTYLGKVLINDIWYKNDPEHEGHKIMFRWTGEAWEEILRTYADASDIVNRIVTDALLTKKFSAAIANVISLNANSITSGDINLARLRVMNGLNEVLTVRDGQVVMNIEKLTINAQEVATLKDLETIELTPGPPGPKGDPGQKGTDGRTSYVHFAYSDSADGTGLTTSDNGQRYIGHYSDYTQADSTDKTKYRWADRWAKIPEDIQASINSKADQALTQEQITALQERAKLVETELKAKASIDAVNGLIDAYQRLTEEARNGVVANEQAIADAAARIVAIQQDLGRYSERVNFLDSYMTRSDEGLIIGRNDGSALIRVAEDRISMLSAGKEVMYISQGLIHIDNGIFTKSIQVGRFRLEQHAVNLDMNVIRYIG